MSSQMPLLDEDEHNMKGRNTAAQLLK